MRVGLRRHRSGRRLRKQLTVNLLGGSLGLDAELTLKDIDAELILPQRRRTPALVGVEAHECPMRHFLQRIEAEQSQRGLNRGLRGPRASCGARAVWRTPRGRARAAAPLGAQPLLELG